MIYKIFLLHIIIYDVNKNGSYKMLLLHIIIYDVNKNGFIMLISEKFHMLMKSPL